MEELITFISKKEIKTAPVSNFKIVKSETKCCSECQGHGEECQKYAWIYCDIRSFFDAYFGDDCDGILSCNYFNRKNKHTK
jgi:hypothetical protein